MITKMYVIDLRSFRKNIKRKLQDKETYKNLGKGLLFLVASVFVGATAIAPDLVNMDANAFKDREEVTDLFSNARDFFKEI